MSMFEENENNGVYIGCPIDRNDRFNFLRLGLKDKGSDIDTSDPHAESILLKRYIQENLLTSKETCELLKVSRQRLSVIVNSGKLIPIKKTSQGNYFLRSDVEAYNMRHNKGEATLNLLLGTLGKCKKMTFFAKEDFRIELAPEHAEITEMKIDRKDYIKMVY